MSNKDSFLAGNAGFVSSFRDGDKPMPPAKKVLVLACMDARLHPEAALGLSIGDAHCVRNAGGRASGDALRSIAISQRLLGTQEVHVIHHTDCGMLLFENADIHAKIHADLGADAGKAASSIDFLPFKDVEQSVRDDVAAIRASPLVADVPVHGFVYDVKTGKVSEVA